MLRSECRAAPSPTPFVPERWHHDWCTKVKENRTCEDETQERIWTGSRADLARDRHASHFFVGVYAWVIMGVCGRRQAYPGNPCDVTIAGICLPCFHLLPRPRSRDGRAAKVGHDRITHNTSPERRAQERGEEGRGGGRAGARAGRRATGLCRSVSSWLMPHASWPIFSRNLGPEADRYTSKTSQRHTLHYPLSAAVS